MDQMIISKDYVSTLPELFRERLKRTPNQLAYQQYDIASQTWTESSWQEMANEVARWQAGFAKENLQPGDRVAVMLKNSREWVVFDQAAMGMGLVTVPLYVDDRPDNVVYIINHAEIQLLFVQDPPQWQRLLATESDLGSLKRIISIKRISEDDQPDDTRLESLSDWLFGLQGELQEKESAADDMATIVYTSGQRVDPKALCYRIKIYYLMPLLRPKVMSGLMMRYFYLSCRCLTCWNVPVVITCL